jgi:hypothetical protein
MHLKATEDASMRKNIVGKSNLNTQPISHTTPYLMRYPTNKNKCDKDLDSFAK